MPDKTLPVYAHSCALHYLTSCSEKANVRTCWWFYLMLRGSAWSEGYTKLFWCRRLEDFEAMNWSIKILVLLTSRFFLISQVVHNFICKRLYMQKHRAQGNIIKALTLWLTFVVRNMNGRWIDVQSCGLILQSYKIIILIWR